MVCQEAEEETEVDDIIPPCSISFFISNSIDSQGVYGWQAPRHMGKSEHAIALLLDGVHGHKAHGANGHIPHSKVGWQGRLERAG